MLTEALVRDWCAENGFKLLKLSDKERSDRYLSAPRVRQIAADVNNIDVESLDVKTRNEHIVFGRLMVCLYYSRIRKRINSKCNKYHDPKRITWTWIGNLCGMSSSDVINNLKNLKNSTLTGWRKENRLEFEIRINEMHKVLEIEYVFNPLLKS